MSKKKNSSSTASASTPTTVVSLTTELFPTALERYIEDYKPDPLSCKQLEGWTLEWKNTTTTHEKDRAVTDAHQNLLQGELHIGGSYMVVTLQVTCAWSASSSCEDKDNHNPQYGSFYYACRAAARFWTKSEFRKRQKQKDGDDDDGSSSRNKKAQEAIRTKMVARLREDAYISKLLSTTLLDEHGDDTATAKPVFVLLAHATIQVDGPNDLEERVDVSEDICEAVKRAVWSSAESPLDVVELLLQLPCLPTTTSQAKNATTTPLANRAKLRLLEDAMVDACEKVGEDGILDDLKLSNDNDTSNGGTSSAASSKKNESNDTAPRKKGKRTL
jgi:hypothetical protein